MGLNAEGIAPMPEYRPNHIVVVGAGVEPPVSAVAVGDTTDGFVTQRYTYREITTVEEAQREAERILAEITGVDR